MCTPIINISVDNRLWVSVLVCTAGQKIGRVLNGLGEGGGGTLRRRRRLRRPAAHMRFISLTK